MQGDIIATKVNTLIEYNILISTQLESSTKESFTKEDIYEIMTNALNKVLPKQVEIKNEQETVELIENSDTILIQNEIDKRFNAYLNKLKS
jgi:hypothetical protein